jgi:Domain of unknown function DUF29
MAKAKRALADPGSLYHRDFFAWTRHQAAVLRRAATRGPISDLDLENLAEEIESLGNRDRRALISQIARVTEHLLSCIIRGWKSPVPVGKARSTCTVRRADSPGLKVELEAILSESYEDGRRFAARSLRNELAPTTLPEVCPYSLDQILNRDWWPRRH